MVCVASADERTQEIDNQRQEAARERARVELLASHAAALASRDDELRSCHLELKHLRKSYDKIYAHGKNKEQEVEQLRSTLDTATSDRQKQQDELDHTVAALSEAQEQLMAATTGWAQCQASLADLQAVVAAGQAELQDTHAVLTETQATVASLRDQCEALTSHLHDADADITTLLDDRAELMAYDAELAAMVAAKATALVTAEAECCTLQAQLAAVMESHDQVTAEREQAVSDKEGLEAIVLQHREAMATNACTLGDTETALAEANAQVHHARRHGVRAVGLRVCVLGMVPVITHG